jgi:STE24 endopeptidase
MLLLALATALDRHVDAIPSTMLLSHTIASLADAKRQAAGARLLSLEMPGWFAAIVFEFAALVYFWRSGSAARVRDALRLRLGSEFAVRFVFGAALALIARIATILPAFYLWRVDRIMGLSSALTRVWAYEYVLGTVLGMIVAGFIVAFTLWIADRTHQWYLYAIASIVCVSLIGTLLAPYIIAPLFERYTPLSGAIAAEQRALVSRYGYGEIPILVEHRLDRIPADTAKTQGMGSTQRIVLADTVVAAATPQEITFYVTAQIAALNDRDPLRLALIDAAIVIVGTAIAVVIADRVPFRRDDDPVSRLALAGALLAVVYIGAVPVDHNVVAGMQLRADREAVEMTGDRISALRALVRSADDRIEEVCPGTLGRIFLYRTASIGERAEAAGGSSGCR